MKIGVIGGGQLGRMMALAGIPLGIRFYFLDPSPEACAGDVGTLILGQYDDTAAIDRLMAEVDVVTFEFESVPAETVAYIAQSKPVFPSADSLAIARERWAEKLVFQTLNIPIAPVYKVENQQDLVTALAEIGLPAIVKTRTLGYDGKGQRMLKTPADIDGLYDSLGSVPLIYEGFVDFDCEVSCIAVRNALGETRVYPLVENVHRLGILHTSTPTRQHPLQALAEQHASTVMNHMDYVGVLTFEFFVQGDQLVANEMAPRVHNSGHWTIEGAQCSQFENHLRAISGLPLGNTEALGYAMMFNLVGCHIDTKNLLAVSGSCLHDYRKAPKPGRKVGHVTLVADRADTLADRKKLMAQLVVNQLT